MTCAHLDLQSVRRLPKVQRYKPLMFRNMDHEDIVSQD
jgi:hypothetical protein